MVITTVVKKHGQKVFPQVYCSNKLLGKEIFSKETWANRYILATKLNLQHYSSYTKVNIDSYTFIWGIISISLALFIAYKSKCGIMSVFLTAVTVIICTSSLTTLTWAIWLIKLIKWYYSPSASVLNCHLNYLS